MPEPMNTATIHFLGTLPPEVRDEVKAWRDALLSVEKPIKDSLRRIAATFNVSTVTARRKYDDFRHSSYDVRVLVNRSKVPETSSALKPEFIEWFKALAENNQRSTRPAYRKFKKLWRSGAEIPGMDNSLPRHELPPGFGEDNIRRKVNDKFALAAMRRGLGHAVARYGPQVLTTRSTLWYGSHLMLDDLWHDNFVVFGKQIVRVLELDALDVFSGNLEDFGTKPRFRREDGVFDNLKEKYARLLVAKIYFQRGYSLRGSTNLVEHGTAALSERVRKILFDASNGLIRTRDSGITGEEQALMGFFGQGKGNPRFKGALESLRNVKHNELADLPAQTGKDRDHRPEQTHGLLVQASEEIHAMIALALKNPRRAQDMKLRLLDYHAHFLPLLIDVYREINCRTHHDLEGWHKAGNVVIEYRTTPSSPHWLTDEEFGSLPLVSQQLLIAAAQEDRRYINSRKLSPWEVAQRGRAAGNMARLPAFAVCDLLGEDFARELKVEGAYFNEFDDHELSPEGLLYESVITTPDNRVEQLSDGKYMVFVNPFDLDQLFVCDARLRCLGLARREQRIDRNDEAAVRRAFGHKAHRVAELKKPLLARHAQTVREEMKRLDHNIAVIEDVEGITEQKAQKKNLRHFAGDIEELAESSPAALTRESTADDTATTEEFSAEGLL